MELFSDWLKREQGIVDPVGLEAAKKRILGEEPEKPIFGQPTPEPSPEPIPTSQPSPSQSPSSNLILPRRFLSERPGGMAPQFNLTTDNNDDRFKNADNIIGDLETNIGNLSGNNTLVKNRDQLLSALKDPKRRQKAVQMVQAMNQLETILGEKTAAMKDLNPDDDSQVINFLEKHMGFRYHDGNLILPDDPNDVKRLFNQGLKNPNVKGGRMMSRQAFLQLFDPDTRAALKSNNLQEIAKNALKNGIPVSKELSDEIFKLLKSPGQYQNWAKEQGVAYLDPEEDVDRDLMDYERVLNPETGEMEFTGMTGLDLLKISDPEAYYNQFSYEPRGLGRGRHLFHKNLITMGNDYVTGANELLRPGRGTVDHIVSAGDRDADARDIESPLNLGISGSGTNFHKVDMGDKPSDLVNFAETYENDKMKMAKGNQIAGINIGLAQQLFGGKEENRENAWLLQRLLKGDFAEPKPQFDTMPELADFVRQQYNFDLPNNQQDSDPGNRFIKKLLDNPRGANKIGQNLANLTTYYPREDHSNRKMTSWSGNPMRSATNWGEYKPLHPFKMALALPGAYNDFSEFGEIERQIRESVMNSNVRDKEGTIAKKILEAKAAQNRRRFQAPIQARGAAWTTGLIDNDQYIEQLYGLLNKSKDFAQAIGGSQVNELFDRGEQALEQYDKLIKEQWPEGRLPSVNENPGWWDAMIGKDPVKKLGSSLYGRQIMPFEQLQRFDELYNSGQIDRRGIVGLDLNDPTTFIENDYKLTINKKLL